MYQVTFSFVFLNKFYNPYLTEAETFKLYKLYKFQKLVILENFYKLREPLLLPFYYIFHNLFYHLFT